MTLARQERHGATSEKDFWAHIATIDPLGLIWGCLEIRVSESPIAVNAVFLNFGGEAEARGANSYQALALRF